MEEQKIQNQNPEMTDSNIYVIHGSIFSRLYFWSGFRFAATPSVGAEMTACPAMPSLPRHQRAHQMVHLCQWMSLPDVSSPGVQSAFASLWVFCICCGFGQSHNVTEYFLCPNSTPPPPLYSYSLSLPPTLETTDRVTVHTSAKHFFKAGTIIKFIRKITLVSGIPASVPVPSSNVL